VSNTAARHLPMASRVTSGFARSESAPSIKQSRDGESRKRVLATKEGGFCSSLNPSSGAERTYRTLTTSDMDISAARHAVMSMVLVEDDDVSLCRSNVVVFCEFEDPSAPCA